MFSRPSLNFLEGKTILDQRRRERGVRWRTEIKTSISLYIFFIYALRYLLQFLCFRTTHRNSYTTKDSFEEAAWKETASIFVPRDSKHSSSIAWHSRRKASKMTRTNFPPFNGKQFGRKAQDAPREGQGSKEGTGGGNE